MKKIKFLFVSLLFSVGALAGCNNEEPKPTPTPEHVHTFSEDWSSNETHHWHAATCGHDVKDGEAVHTFESDGKCTVCNYYDETHDDSKIFTDEKLGAFKGTFYNGDSIFTINATGASINNGEGTIELQNDTIKGSGFSTVVTYKGPGNSAYTLKWENAEWDLNELNLMLPTLVSDDNELQLQPSVEAAQGWYDGWEGYMDSSTYIYIVTNEYNAEVEAFQMYGAILSSSFLGQAYYLRSSFVEVDGKMELGLSWFDNTDIEVGYNYFDWNYYLVKDEETGRLNMAVFGEEGEEPFYYWWTRPSFFLGEFLKQSSLEYSLGEIFGDWIYDSYTFWADEDLNTVSINYGEDLPYTEGYDEEGAYVLVDGSKYRGTSTGITIESVDRVEYCPVFFFYDFSNLQWYNYISGTHSIAFVIDTDDETWESIGYLSIDGVKAEESYLTIVDGSVAIGATNGGDEYFLLPYDGTEAVLVGKNENLTIYINDSKMSEFVGSYFDQEFNELTIDLKEKGLSVTFVGKTFEAGLTYTDDFGVVVTFSEDGMIVPLDAETGLYALLMGDSIAYLFNVDYFVSALGDWTNGIINATFNDDELLTATFAGQDMNILGLIPIQSSYGNLLPAFIFGTNSVQYVATIDPNNMYIFEMDELGNLNYISSFIRPIVFEKFYGEFYYMGEYGLENVILTEEGVLTVTTMNQKGDGIIDQQFSYEPFSSSSSSGLEFEFKEVPVDIIYDGKGHCSIFNVVYLAKVFFNNQGLFGTTSENYLSVVDNSLVFNGTKMVITSFSDNSVIGLISGTTTTVVFEGGNAKVTVGTNEAVVLPKTGVKVASFACDVKKNVGDLGEDIKVTSDGKILAHNVNDPEDVWYEITDYEFGINENGSFIKARYKMAYTYTISIVKDEVVITGESSLLPPPLPF